MDFLTILADSGLVTLEGSFSDAKATFTRDVYNALRNGSDAVLIFSHDANEDILAAATSAVEDTDTLVLQCHDTKRKGKDKGKPYSAKDLRAAIERRNGNNPSAPGDTWGNVSISDPISDPSSGELIGFVVR